MALRGMQFIVDQFVLVGLEWQNVCTNGVLFWDAPYKYQFAWSLKFCVLLLNLLFDQFH